MVSTPVVTLMMRPQPFLIMWGAAARDMLNGPLALVSMIERQASGVTVTVTRNFGTVPVGSVPARHVSGSQTVMRKV